MRPEVPDPISARQSFRPEFELRGGMHIDPDKKSHLNKGIRMRRHARFARYGMFSALGSATR